jgi:mannobiose 2-epimerase
MKKYLLLILLFASSVSFAQMTTDPDSIKQQMKYAAKEGLLDKYYPRNIDTLYGGYLSTFTYDIQPTGDQEKMVVTQARHVWSTAKASIFYHDTSYIAMSRHGFLFLKDKMWDKKYGGFYNLTDRQGNPKTLEKLAYGNAFAIYAIAAYYDCSKDTAALNFAKKAFMWMEKHSHDPKYKGYFQFMKQDGTPEKRKKGTNTPADFGYKDQNSSIHILEALTELYHVWPDPLVKTRLNEMLLLIRDVIVTPKGYLQLFFTPEWKPVTFSDSSEEAIHKNHNLDHVSFGHDVETAFLMQEAAEALGNIDDKVTKAVGKRMVDHALKNGWDDTLGGFYDEGYYFKNKPGLTIMLDTKNWWAQAEGLNTLQLFAVEYPDDKMNYYQYFAKLWQYSQNYLIDHQYGDWYEGGIDKQPQLKTANKAHIWKGTYHNFRSLRNCIMRFENGVVH